MIEYTTSTRGLLPPLKTQVLVVGSGGAGLLAAMAAGRNGADVTLVEYQGFVGGISSTLTWLGFHDQEYRLVVKGIPLEIVARLQAAGEAGQFALDPKCSSALSLDNHYYKCLAVELLEEADVKLLLHTHVVDTLREGDRVAGVVVEHKSGRQHLLADVVIDCSGDGDVAARGGAGWAKGRTADGLVQSPTLVFRLGGVDRDEPDPRLPGLVAGLPGVARPLPGAAPEVAQAPAHPGHLHLRRLRRAGAAGDRRRRAAPPRRRGSSGSRPTSRTSSWRSRRASWGSTRRTWTA